MLGKTPSAQNWLKETSPLLLKLFIAGIGFAAFTSSYASSNNLAASSPGFSIQLTGLYLQPNANNLNYAVYTHPLPLPTPNWEQVTLKPNYDPAFNLGLQYDFANSSNKVNIDWFYFDATSSSSFQKGGGITSVAPPYYFGPLAQSLTGSSAESQAKFVVSNLNMTLGHLFNIDNSIQLDVFGGVSAVYLKEDITSTYLGVGNNSVPYSITSYNTSKFNGIGPRIGINANYLMGHGFGISARFGSTLFTGSQNSNTNFKSFGAGNTTPANTTLADQDTNMIVTEFDGKLEINYLIPSKGDHSSITLALGYLFTAYINGITQVVPTALVPGAFNNGSIAIETSAQTQSDLSLNGPYASVIWKI